MIPDAALVPYSAHVQRFSEQLDDHIRGFQKNQHGAGKINTLGKRVSSLLIQNSF